MTLHADLAAPLLTRLEERHRPDDAGFCLGEGSRWPCAFEHMRRDRDHWRTLAGGDDAGDIEQNHYDWFFPKDAPHDLSEEWLTATEAKMREALSDPFVDDAARVMLILIEAVRTLSAQLVEARERETALAEALRDLVDVVVDEVNTARSISGRMGARLSDARAALGHPETGS